MNTDMTITDVINTFDCEQREMLYQLTGYALETGRNYIAGNGNFDNHIQRKLRKIYNGLNKGQKTVVTYLVNEAINEFKSKYERRELL